MNEHKNPHELDGLLQSLGQHDLDPIRTARIRRQAHSVLDRERKANRPWLEPGYARFLEPVLVTGVSIATLVFALQRIAYILL